jgi:hexosaminidase
MITGPDLQQKFITADSINFLLTKPGVYRVQQVAKKPVLKNEKLVPIGSAVSMELFFNKLTGKSVTITKKPNEKYPGQPGAFSLVNGIYSKKGLSFPDWLGWIGDDMEATIDLGKKDTLSWVRMHTINQNGSWIYLPKSVEVQVSDDGKNFTSVGQSDVFVTDTLTMGWITVRFPEQRSQYIRVIAKNYGLIPDNLPGGGTKAWLFADELQAGKNP